MCNRDGSDRTSSRSGSLHDQRGEFRTVRAIQTSSALSLRCDLQRVETARFRTVVNQQRWSFSRATAQHVVHMMLRTLHDGVTDVPGAIGIPGLGLLGGSGVLTSAYASSLAWLKGAHFLPRPVRASTQSARYLVSHGQCTPFSIRALDSAPPSDSRRGCTMQRKRGRSATSDRLRHRDCPAEPSAWLHSL